MAVAVVHIHASIGERASVVPADYEPIIGEQVRPV